MDWPVRMVSAYRSDFDYDMNVSYRPEDLKAGRAIYNFEPYDGEMEDTPAHVSSGGRHSAGSPGAERPLHAAAAP
jgi:predicted dithiol-disulfide oxidoreductase (DUF899 family)